ncbi:MAG: hypothetical protein HY810_03640, partial [Candidatus Omnitrophica bacterium]|nr:hypothetical protein [Candidatus Omnitrophota bacterium]
MSIDYAADGQNFTTNISSNADASDNVLNSVPWTVPNEIGTDNKIRISDNETTYTPATTKTSAYFTIKGQLKMLEPAGGESSYGVSTSQDIRWKYAGTISSNLNFYLDNLGGGGGYLTLINQSGPIAYNLSEASYICYYPWTTPATAGTQYSIKIEPSDNTQADTVTTDATNFRVRGTITLEYPGKGAGEVWYVNDNVNNKIDWTVTGGIPTVDIYLDTNGAPYTNQTTIVLDHVSASQKPYIWQIPDNGLRESVTSDTCRILIYDGNDPTVTDQSTSNFKIKPRVILDALSGTPWTIGQTPTISWDSSGNVGKVRVYYSNDDKANWNLVKPVSFTAGSTGSTSWYIDPAASFENVTQTGKLSYIKLIRFDGDVEDTDAGISAASAGFTIYGKLTLNSPLTPQNYNVLSTNQPINWSVDGAVGNIEIKYSTNDAGGYPDASFTGHIAGPIAANWCELNGNYGMTIPNDPQAKVKIRVREINNPNIVKCDTAVCSFKGNILFNQGTTNGQNLIVGTQHTISWENVGDFSSTYLKVYYRKNGASWQDINPNLAGNAGGVQSCPWTPIDTDISDDIDFKVELGSDSTVWRETDQVGASNSVSGSLVLVSPTLGTETYTVGQQGTISWLKYGSIGDLKIELNTGSGWLNNTTDGTNLPDNQNSGASGATQSYNTWNVPDKITNNGQIRVTSNSYPVLTDETEAIKKFKIKGVFNSLSEPNASTIWKVGNNQTITWDATGDMDGQGVKIEIWTPLGGYETIENNYGVGTLQSGTNSYTWTYTGAAIQDKMTDNCKIKVSSVTHPDVSIETPVGFKFIPKITVTDMAAQVVAETKPTLQWSYTGTKLGNVNVVFDPNGDGNLADGTPLLSGVSRDSGAGAGIPALTALPDTLTTSGKIVVSDETAAYASGATGFFETIGWIEITQPNGSTTWKVGDPTNNILWNYKGAIGNVKVWADYNGNGVYDGFDENLSDSMPAGAAGLGSLEWPGNIDDRVSTGAKIWVESLNTSVKDDSIAFNILGDIKLDTDVYGIGGKVIKIKSDDSQSLAIGWYTQGSAINEVKIQYSLNGLGGTFFDIVTVANSLYGPYEATTNPLTVNTYTWDNNSPAPIPTATKTMDGVIKVIAVISGVPQLATSDNSAGQGKFVISGNIEISPNLDGEVWETDGTTPHTITWNFAGPITKVDVRYAAGGVDYLLYPALATNIDVDTAPLSDGSGYYNWTIPSTLTDDLISNGKQAKIKVLDNTMSTYAFAESQTFTIKSKLNFSAGTLTTLSNGLRAGTVNQAIVVERKGKNAGFDLKYSRNEGVSYALPNGDTIIAGATFDAGS